MRADDLGLLPYRDAWAVQEAAHDEVIAGGAERILLVEHPPVVTFGRRAGVERNLLASSELLAEMGVEVVQSDRGGDITFHGPGQLVAYLIHDLGRGERSVRRYVARLEESVIRTLAGFGVAGAAEPGYPGVWLGRDKIAALGVAVSRGVTYHGIALNVDVDLRFFDYMIPCGLPGRGATSLARALGQAPPLAAVTDRFIASVPDVFESDMTEGLTLDDLRAIGERAVEGETTVGRA